MSNDLELEVVRGFVTRLPGLPDTARPDQDWHSVRLTVTAETVDAARLVDVLARANVQTGWLTTTDAVFFRDEKGWQPLKHPGQVEEMPTERILEGDLGFSEGAGLRVRHIRGSRWHLQWLHEGNGVEHLAVDRTHYTILPGRTLSFRVYWDLSDLPGDAAAQSYQPVATRLVGFGTKEVA